MISDPIPIALGSIAAVWFGLAVARRHFSYKRAAKQEKCAQEARTLSLRRNLLVKTLGNESQVDSLIDLERQKFGNLPEDEAMEAAIERWEKDNR